MSIFQAPILIVDDDAASLMAMQEVLKSLGSPLVTASSGEEALRCVLEDDFAASGLRQRHVQVCLEIIDRLESEDAALSTRVGGLEDRREADGLRRGRRVTHRARRGELWLRHTFLRELAPHRDLVRHRVSDVRAHAR